MREIIERLVSPDCTPDEFENLAIDALRDVWNGYRAGRGYGRTVSLVEAFLQVYLATGELSKLDA